MSFIVTDVASAMLHTLERHHVISILDIAPRALKPICDPLKSGIRDHSETKNHSISISNYKVLHTCKFQVLTLSESLLTHKLCLNLNAQDSSTPQKILG